VTGSSHDGGESRTSFASHGCQGGHGGEWGDRPRRILVVVGLSSCGLGCFCCCGGSSLATAGADSLGLGLEGSSIASAAAFGIGGTPVSPRANRCRCVCWLAWALSLGRYGNGMCVQREQLGLVWYGTVVASIQTGIRGLN
jgi:hypothetical protein